ncbi:MAG: DUF1467 family protein [Bradyrhizobium sp.]
MAYTISTWAAIYFVLWWVTLFFTLPFGVQSQHEQGVSTPGTDPGAPVASLMGRKVIWTTIISTIIFAVSIFVYEMGFVSLNGLAKLMGVPF